MAVVTDEERSRVLSALAIISKLAQVRCCAYSLLAIHAWVSCYWLHRVGVVASALGCIYGGQEGRSSVLVSPFAIIFELAQVR